MKITMAHDRRSYAGGPVDIVRKLRADAVHLKTRDVDGYVRAVVSRLRAEQRADIAIAGETLDERCEAFLAAILRAGMAAPVFHRDHVDAAAIRVLRRARGLTQERLAALLQVSFATVNRWEAGEHAPSSTRALEQELFAHFTAPGREDEPVAPPRHAGVMVQARERARRRFRVQGARADAAINKRV